MHTAHHTLDLLILVVFCLSFVTSHELTVRSYDLKKCSKKLNVCVTNLKDCDPRPSASRPVPVNMSCYFQPYPEYYRNNSMTCAWSYGSNTHIDPVYSLLFSKKVVRSCRAIFSPTSILNVTLKMGNNVWETEEKESWSQPYTVFLSDIVKVPQPVLTLVNTTVDSMFVSWRASSSASICQLCYRTSSSPLCSQIPGSIPVKRETMAYMIKDLLPYTPYGAKVACKRTAGNNPNWSDWSVEVKGTTLEKAPSSPPDTCYFVERKGSGGPLHLHLMWKALEFHEAGGRILGYQVMYTPVKKTQQQTVMCNSTDLTALLVVEEGPGSVSVTAFNGAGQGPATLINIDTRVQHTLSPVRHLWVLSPGPSKRGLLVQWETDPIPHTPPPAPDPPVSHFDIQWTPETQPSTSHSTRVDGLSTSTVIQDHLHPGQDYIISVYPIYSHLCGPARSLPARLEHGALLEAVKLNVVGVTKTTATAEWVWQRKPEPIRVDRYRLELKMDSEKQALSVWPDQWEHTFHNLRANAKYSLLLLADNTTREIVNFRTDFDEIETVAAVTPLLLLVFALVVICILTRTVYRSYFFPYISSPRGSTAGQWLMDEHHQKSEMKSILSIEDFQVTDIVGGKSSIELGPDTRQTLTAEDKPGSTSTPSPNHPNIKYVAVHAEYIANIPFRSTTEHTGGVSQIPCNSEYVMNCPRPQSDSSEESGEVSSLSLMPCEAENGADCHFPFLTQLELGKQKAFAAVSCCETSFVVNSLFPEMVAKSNKDQGAPLIHCETEYLLSSNFLTKNTDEVEIGVEIGKQTGNPQLPCETGYVDNSHSPEGTTSRESVGLSLTLCNASCAGNESDDAVNCPFPEGTIPESPQMYCCLDYVKQ